MPPPGGRKVPFSGKAKRLQLKIKKGRQEVAGEPSVSGRKFHKKTLLKRPTSNDSDEESGDEVAQVKPIFNKDRSRNANRYALQFYKESKEEIAQRKEFARQTLSPVTNEEIDSVDIFPVGMSIPKRPPWNFSMGREELEAREQRYFTNYINGLEKEYTVKNLSYFELNLETWRQLWRVLEMSDIVLIICDARFPALMFPPSVYQFVTEELKKNMILILNKIDLVPAHVVVAWKQYFLSRYPTLQILTFTSYPTYNLRNNPTETKSGLQVRRRKGRQKMTTEGALKLYEACNAICKGQVDLASWHMKILEEQLDDSEDENTVRPVVAAAPDTGYQEHERFKDGILTIGCIGQPNVGKSSLMNAVMGKKVVSVSRTPGHTKHFQTIYLTQNVRLCDCPGLVFPSITPRCLQILIGSYPIAQVREPFTAVKYLSERVDLIRLLAIEHPEGDDTWSAMDICDGWAKKRGFHTAKAARLDSYRAANNILRMALDGKICMVLKPPGYHAQEDDWKKHPDVSEVMWIQAARAALGDGEKLEALDEDDFEEDDEQDASSSEAQSSMDEDVVAGTAAIGNKFELLADDDD